MPPFAWVLAVLAVGALLIFGASRATVAVTEGPAFVRWMVVVFAAFLILASIPLLAGS
ncbi:MAG: hypothetical protein RLN75_00340 [Longimicrobiales bacterium]